MKQDSAVRAYRDPSIPDLEKLLANMELRALKVIYPDERARIFNLAGDLCFDAGSRERALSYFGRAIDVFLADQLIDAAVAVCRKIVRLTPEVVRARCTLAWMALGRGLIVEARQRIEDYARAAASAGQERAASRHLRLMTNVAENQEVLESLANALLELGDDVGADRAFGAAMGHGARTDIATDPDERLSVVLRVLNGNESPPPSDETITVEDEDEPSELPSVNAATVRRLRRTRDPRKRTRRLG